MQGVALSSSLPSKTSTIPSQAPPAASPSPKLAPASTVFEGGHSSEDGSFKLTLASNELSDEAEDESANNSSFEREIEEISEKTKKSIESSEGLLQVQDKFLLVKQVGRLLVSSNTVPFN